jgi:hypothetical protein
LASPYRVPNLLGYAEFWRAAWIWPAPYLWRFIEAPHGRLAIVFVSLLLIWWDQVRITKKLHGKKPYDERTRKGRTLKLRDEVQEFLETIRRNRKSVAQRSLAILAMNS